MHAAHVIVSARQPAQRLHRAGPRSPPQQPSTWPLQATCCSVETAHPPTCRATQLLEPHLSTLAPLVLGAFGDKHAGNHASLWDMVLNFLKAFPRAWHQVDIRKAFLPKLYSFLRSVQLQRPTHCMAAAAARILHGIVLITA